MKAVLRVGKLLVLAVGLYFVVLMASRLIVERMILGYGPYERFPLVVYVVATVLAWIALKYGIKAIAKARRKRGRCPLCQATSDVDKQGVCVDDAECDARQRVSKAASQTS